MPVLNRLVPAPVLVSVHPGALGELRGLLAGAGLPDGRVALAVSGGSGLALAEELRRQWPAVDVFCVRGGGIDDAVALAAAMGPVRYDLLIGAGGGRVVDVAKYAAARLGVPMVSVPTALSHDGMASPVSILDNDAGRGSYGVPPPVAVVVDLDVVRRAPAATLRAGVGEVLSNLTAVADWDLSRRSTGEVVDGLASAMARSAAESVLRHPGALDEEDFLTVLADALVLSGTSMLVAGSTRPCSGACHEISHAIDLLHPGKRALHGAQVALGGAFATWLRGDLDGHAQVVAAMDRHGLAVDPVELGLTVEEFTLVVSTAPSTRPGRHTVLEELDLSLADILGAVEQYRRHLGVPAAATARSLPSLGRAAADGGVVPAPLRRRTLA